MPDIPNSQDAQARITAAASSQASALLENNKNLIVNQVKNQIINAATTSLPAPLNVAAQGLGNALFAAFKVPLDPVRQPAPPNSDPIKVLAFSIAFAIIQLIWCLIKSLLNPLPIIGSFFPLCDDPATRDDSSNKSLDNAKKELTNLTNNSFLNQEVLKKQQEAGRSQATVLDSLATQNEADSAPDIQGVSFEDFLKNNGIGSGEQTTQTPSLGDIQPTGVTNATSAQVTQPPAQNVLPQWESSEQTFDVVRRRFGL